ncbi:MAG: hypothetical protein JNL21_21045 [Myxococcales bacterium]|nr:hypothetical protein [Myxococcales bacterium]
MSASKLVRVGMGFLGACGAALAFASCLPEYANNELNCPPYEDFAAVSTLLERRCGTLDCHGDGARPLRIYGQYGLRLKPEDSDDDTLFSGNLERATTEIERESNYRSVCGLEPELTHQVVNGELAVERLTLVRKPRLSEKHKGGRIWNEGKPPDRCLVTWLESKYEPGTMDTADCEAAVTE